MAIDINDIKNVVIDLLELCGDSQDYYKLNHADTTELENFLIDWLEKQTIEVIR